MAITAKDVKALRDATGLGMSDCKNALEEANGDMDKAAEIVRTKFGAKMAGRTDRESSEGKIAVAGSGTKAAIVQINTETDFTANNEAFGQMAQAIADAALTQEPGDVNVTEAMEAAMQEVRLTTGENVQFGAGKVFGGDNHRVGTYVHFTGKVGVMVDIEGEATDELLKDLCMHISAIHPAPLGVTEDEIPADVIEAEKKHAMQEAIDSGKPEEIAEKMVVGKMRKFMDSVVLTRQPFVKDDKVQIQSLLPKGTTIKSFVKLNVG